MKIFLSLYEFALFWSTLSCYHHLYHSIYPLSNNDHDCFYRFENSSNDLAHHLITYCIRHTSISSARKCFGTEFTFDGLRINNVTSQKLFEWFAPIDVIDDYEGYLSTKSRNDSRNQVYCNCSDPLSFGTHCQYHFTVGNEQSSFDDIVQLTLVGNEFNEDDIYWMNERNSTTCYLHLNCTTYTGYCLDWREINDGIVHCINGTDEEHFVTMELSDCNDETEYRCRNGLCIPRSFLLDRTFDCPDWYDEPGTQNNMLIDSSRLCPSKMATAECEEYNLGLNFLPCGDGQRLPIRSERGHSCSNLRNVFMLKTLFRPYFNQNFNDSCNLTMMCLFNVLCLFEACPNGLKQHCEELLSTNGIGSCSQSFFFPPGPFIYPFIRLLYGPRKLWDSIYPDFICWNESVCNIYHDDLFFTYDGFKCVSSKNFQFHKLTENYSFTFYLPTRVLLLIQSLFSHCTHEKKHSKLYTCASHLTISYYRVLDSGFSDCFPWLMLREDEVFTNETYQLACLHPDRIRCSSVECIPRRLIRDGIPHCYDAGDELFFVGCTNEFDCQYLRELNLHGGRLFPYQVVCDGQDLYGLLEFNSDSGDTDETDCEMWPCDAPHTHCNGIWNRPNGCDELNCPLSPKLSCKENEHFCPTLNSSITGCLPLNKTGDYHIDCLFGADECRTLLEVDYGADFNFITNTGELYKFYNVSCWNHFNKTIESKQVCDGKKDCPLGDDELFCYWQQNFTCHEPSQFLCKNGTCISKTTQWCNGVIDCAEGEDERLCHILKTQPTININLKIPPQLPFSIDRFTEIERRLVLNKNIPQCHRGITIRNQIDNTDVCLCPSSYYGVQCELQSERLTIFYRVDIPFTFDRSSIYRFIFYLLDENHTVLTQETMIFVPSNEQFSHKHMIYLNYPRFTENHLKFSKKLVLINTYQVTNNSVEPVLLSWFYFVQFSDFLPVTRLSALLYLEPLSSKQISSCRNFGPCQHGVCQVFINSGAPFCHCDDGWFGHMCEHRQSTDLCAKLNCNRQFSKCVVYNNHASCLCALNRIGPTCQISFDACTSNRCQNNGTCLSLDERTIQQVCICPASYFGNLCQYTSAQLKLDIPSSMPHIPILNIHFLQSPETTLGILIHRDIFFFRNVHPNTQLVVDYADQNFLPPIILAQLFNTTSLYSLYYLLVLSNANRSHLTTRIQERHRCPHVDEYLNTSLRNAVWLKRIKFYHLYMKNVRCFYDEVYMCFVDKNGFPDCLSFNHNITNCAERNYCENNGRCLQRRKLGQLDYMCVCPQCTSGVFCQIQMSQFSLTLDTLLGQTIVTDVSLHAQPAIIKVVLVLSSILFTISLGSNICSFNTFRHKDIYKIGCGRYLLILPITNQIAMSVFLARVIFLIYSQMTIISNKQLSKVSCLLFDFILQLSISFCDWLHCCIACERTLSALKGIHFNIRQSIRRVKIIVPLLLLSVVLTSIHHVFNRDLISDPRSDDRLWCVIRHRHAWLRTYEICINIFNNFIPSFVNLVSGIVLLISISSTHERVVARERYRSILLSEIIEHKDLLIAPVTMIIAKLPLLIVSLAIKCVTTQWQSYISLAAYFLSLLPLVSTFLIFIWPSSFYMTKFKEKFSCIKRLQ